MDTSRVVVSVVKNVMKKQNINQMVKCILIPVDDIINTPNDMDLGGKIRKMYWDMLPTSNENPWVCRMCGKDTSHLDFENLFGTDHIGCHLKNQE